MPPIYRVSVTFTDADNTVRVMQDTTEYREYAQATLMRHTVLSPADIDSVLGLVEHYKTTASSTHGERYIEVEFIPEDDE